MCVCVLCVSHVCVSYVCVICVCHMCVLYVCVMCVCHVCVMPRGTESFLEVCVCVVSMMMCVCHVDDDVRPSTLPLETLIERNPPPGGGSYLLCSLIKNRV